MSLFRRAPPPSTGPPQGVAGDAFDQAAQADGKTPPTVTQDPTRTSLVWKVLFFPLAFRNLRAGVWVLAGILVSMAIWYWVGWQVLLFSPIAAAFAWYWWKVHYRVDTVTLIEVRAEGQKFRPPHLPFHFVVRDSGFRIFQAPRKVYDEALKYGVYHPVFQTPPWLVICDWFDPERNIIIFNEDPEWTNFAIVAQMSEGLAKNLRRRLRKEDWLTTKEREAVAQYKQGKLDEETLRSILVDLEEQLDIVRESPYTKRSFAHYYQDSIPRLKRQVIELLKGIEELAFALAAELAYDLYNQPMTPEIEGQVRFVKTKYGKMKIHLFEDFDFMPELYEHLGEKDAGRHPLLHDLAQRAAGGTSRPASTLAPKEDINERVL